MSQYEELLSSKEDKHKIETDNNNTNNASKAEEDDEDFNFCLKKLEP